MEAMREAWSDDRLDDLNRKVDGGFLAVDQRFDQVDRRFDQVDRRFEQVDRRFEQVDQRFDQIDKRLDRVDKRLDRVDDRLERMDAHFGDRLGAMQRTQVLLCGGIIAGLIGVIASILATGA